MTRVVLGSAERYAFFQVNTFRQLQGIKRASLLCRLSLCDVQLDAGRPYHDQILSCLSRGFGCRDTHEIVNHSSLSHLLAFRPGTIKITTLTGIIVPDESITAVHD